MKIGNVLNKFIFTAMFFCFITFACVVSVKAANNEKLFFIPTSENTYSRSMEVVKNSSKQSVVYDITKIKFITITHPASGIHAYLITMNDNVTHDVDDGVSTTYTYNIQNLAGPAYFSYVHGNSGGDRIEPVIGYGDDLPEFDAGWGQSWDYVVGSTNYGSFGGWGIQDGHIGSSGITSEAIDLYNAQYCVFSLRNHENGSDRIVHVELIGPNGLMQSRDITAPRNSTGTAFFDVRFDFTDQLPHGSYYIKLTSKYANGRDDNYYWSYFQIHTVRRTEAPEQPPTATFGVSEAYYSSNTALKLSPIVTSTKTYQWYYRNPTGGFTPYTGLITYSGANDGSLIIPAQSDPENLENYIFRIVVNNSKGELSYADITLKPLKSTFKPKISGNLT